MSTDLQKLSPVLQQYINETVAALNSAKTSEIDAYDFKSSKFINPLNIGKFLVNNKMFRISLISIVLFLAFASVWFSQILPLWGDVILFLAGVIISFYLIEVLDKASVSSLQEAFKGSEIFLKKQTLRINISAEETTDKLYIHINNVTNKKSKRIHTISLEKNTFDMEDVALFSVQLEEALNTAFINQQSSLEADVIGSSLKVKIDKDTCHPFLNEENKKLSFGFDISSPEKFKEFPKKTVALHKCIKTSVFSTVIALIFLSITSAAIGTIVRIEEAIDSPYKGYQKIHTMIKNHQFDNVSLKDFTSYINQHKKQENSEYLDNVKVRQSIYNIDDAKSDLNIFEIKYVLKSGTDQVYRYTINSKGKVIDSAKMKTEDY